MTSGPTLTMAEAVKRSTCSESTLRRKLKAGEVEGAVRNDDGSWSIPIAGLVAAGLLSKVTPPDNENAELAAEMAEPYARDEIEKRVAELEHRAETLRIERDAARAELERADQTIEAQAIALRALEAGPYAEPVTASQTAPKPREVPPAPTPRAKLTERLSRWLG